MAKIFEHHDLSKDDADIDVDLCKASNGQAELISQPDGKFTVICTLPESEFGIKTQPEPQQQRTRNPK